MNLPGAHPFFPTRRWFGRGLGGVLLPLGVLTVIVAAWQLAVQADTSTIRIFPAPSDVLAAMVRTRETLLTQHIPQTMLETSVGMALALVLGLLVAAALDFL